MNEPVAHLLEELKTAIVRLENELPSKPLDTDAVAVLAMETYKTAAVINSTVTRLSTQK